MSKIIAKNDFVITRSERPTTVIARIKTEEYKEKEEWMKEAPILVVSVGPKVEGVKVGDSVLINMHKAMRSEKLVKVMEEKDPENVTYFICKVEDVVAVIE